MFPQAVTLQHNRHSTIDNSKDGGLLPKLALQPPPPAQRQYLQKQPGQLYQAVLAKVGDRAEVRRVIGRQHKDPLSQSSGLGIGPGRYNRRFITDVIVCIGRWRCSGLEGLGI